MKQINVAVSLFLWGSTAFAQQTPLSAIDWLDQIVANPVAQPLEDAGEPAVTDTAVTPQVDVMPLDTANADAVGLLPSSTTGLPASLWSASETRDVTKAMARIDPVPLPALQALYYTLLLAEAEAPADTGKEAVFLRARLDVLTSFGAVDPARALIERAGPMTPALFDHWLNLSLLSGSEDAACQALREDPSLSDRYASRIYCTARAGDWPTAALTYETALALESLTQTEAKLLAIFLDPEVAETEPTPDPPKVMTPLIFRLFEAAGSPLPTSRLPRAFAMADLRETSAWRAEIEAAERLARTNALPANRLLGLYTERRAAASGGVWDRVRAIQALDAAIQSGDADAIADALPTAWRKMQAHGLQSAFAQLYADPLRLAPLTGDAATIAFKVTLLSDAYEEAARILPSPDDGQSFLIGLAAGNPDAQIASSSREKAIARAFAATGPSSEHAPLINAGKIGEAILLATNQLDGTQDGNLSDMVGALSTLRALGLEDTARRAALQLLILGPA